MTATPDLHAAHLTALSLLELDSSDSSDQAAIAALLPDNDPTVDRVLSAALLHSKMVVGQLALHLGVDSAAVLAVLRDDINATFTPDEEGEQ